MYNTQDRFKIRAKVVDTRFSDSNNFYKVLTVEILEQENLDGGRNYLPNIEIMSGIIPIAEAGQILECEVEVVRHSRYGFQLKLVSELKMNTLIADTVTDNIEKQIEKEFIQATSVELIYNSILECMLKHINNEGRKLTDICVITTYENGILGGIDLNERLQKDLNPFERDKREIIVWKYMKIFRVGDPVITIKDNQLKQVNRGSIGFINKIYDDYFMNQKQGKLFGNYDSIKIREKMIPTMMEVIFFDDNEEKRKVEYTIDEFEQLELAYALTSDLLNKNKFPVVIMPMYKYNKEMTHYNLIYTALEIAEEKLTVIGNKMNFPDLIENVIGTTIMTS